MQNAIAINCQGVIYNFLGKIPTNELQSEETVIIYPAHASEIILHAVYHISSNRSLDVDASYLCM